jgi:PadR family transcriptional regulator AphA
MNNTRVSLTEYAVLGVLAEQPSHGFALSKQLGPDGPVGRVLTVRRPLVYRALDRLVTAGLAAPQHTERGRAGPQRVIHRATGRGHRELGRWLQEPVEHVRDLRIDFLLKLTLLDRGGASPLPLVMAQQRALTATFAAIADTRPADHVELWRRHNVAAAAAYLAELEQRYG